VHLRTLVAIATLLCVAGCSQAVGGRAAGARTTAPTTSTPSSLGVLHGSALRFRPVLQQMPASANGGCGTDQDPLAGKDDPTLPLIACDQAGTVKYALGPAILTGDDVDSVSAGPNANGGGYVINLTFRSAGSSVWANWTNTNVGKQVAFVLGARVLSAPNIKEAILGGSTQISGNFTAKDAQRLAHQIAGY
jgi:preprotein translocase subunit SecD